jgi:hypothetical protein
MPRSDVLAKLGEQKNDRIQATIKTSLCALFSCMCALKDSQNSLVSKSEKFLELAFKTQKVMTKLKRAENVPNFVTKCTTIKNNLDNNLFLAVFGFFIDFCETKKLFFTCYCHIWNMSEVLVHFHLIGLF